MIAFNNATQNSFEKYNRYRSACPNLKSFFIKEPTTGLYKKTFHYGINCLL